MSDDEKNEAEKSEETPKDACRCGSEGSEESHSCPFASEIRGNSDEDFCNCCDYCTSQCSADI